MTTYKILGQTFPAANTETVSYSTPSASSSLVRSINITNTSGTADTFDVAIMEDGNVPVSNNVYVVVSENFSSSAAASSTNGITWTARTLPFAASFSNVASGNNVFVVVSTKNTHPSAAYSTNGTTWIAATMPSTASWYSVSFGNSTFAAVALSSAAAATSTNGITWTARTLPSSTTWYSVKFGGGVFAATSDTLASASSTDGITWTARTLPTTGLTSKMTYSDDTFVVVGGTNKVATSTDAITWTQRTIPVTTNKWSSVAYGNGVFVAGSYGSAGLSATSTDGITWTARSMPVPSSASEWRLAFYNGIFVGVRNGVSTNGAVYSTDGIAWISTSLPSSTGWSYVYGDSYLALSTTTNKDYIFKSTPILGNETITVKAGYTMSENDQVRVRSNNGTSNFHVFGAEI
jgi:hypothetical protein